MEDLAKSICQSKKNANQIIELLSGLESANSSSVGKTIEQCVQVFRHFIRHNLLLDVKVRRDAKDHSLATDDNEVSTVADDASKTADEALLKSRATEQVDEWILEKYKFFVDQLLLLCVQHEGEVGERSLVALMELMLAEYSAAVKARTKQITEKEAPLNFPNQFFIKIVKILLLLVPTSSLLEKFCEQYLKQADVKYYTLKNIDSLIRNQNILSKPPYCDRIRDVSENCYSLLTRITYPEDIEQEDLYLNQANVDRLTISTVDLNKHFRQVFSSAWFALLRIPNLSKNLHRKVLLDMDSKIIPNMADPKLLIDFLTDSYNEGGATSLLALNGLFTLINSYNLDYPDFYGKLYCLLEPNIFFVKYKARFFHLMDLFLTSPYLPAYLVAAFVKRLGRLCLFAPVGDVLVMLGLIKNLLTRHPTCQVLIHRKSIPSSNSAEDSIVRDPYQHEEKDPSKCNALQSSLWEIESLKNHYHGNIIKSVESFKKEFKKTEVDISKHFDTDYETLIQTTLDKGIQDENPPAMNFEQPKTLFDEADFEMWSFE